MAICSVINLLILKSQAIDQKSRVLNEKKVDAENILTQLRTIKRRK